LTDKLNSTKSGRYLEVLGNYDPRKGGERVIKADRVKYWISKGAKTTGTIHNMLVDTKTITGKKINVLPRKSPIKKEETEEKAKASESAPKAEASASETPVKETPAETPKN